MRYRMELFSEAQQERREQKKLHTKKSEKKVETVLSRFFLITKKSEKKAELIGAPTSAIRHAFLTYKIENTHAMSLSANDTLKLSGAMMVTLCACSRLSSLSLSREICEEYARFFLSHFVQHIP